MKSAVKVEHIKMKRHLVKRKGFTLLNKTLFMHYLCCCLLILD